MLVHASIRSTRIVIYVMDSLKTLGMEESIYVFTFLITKEMILVNNLI